ncbi:AAA family ATPase [Clostridium folliculivorans]|uniref:AAA family ATPase n=1 Tax=Clostridium folliculivorans TaxID=2886038 RepID=UPI0021C420AE|nr:AAA family ATPase [Clostridium folliculivorans]GKU30522.1 topology modulation protein [Clostridium folliculivorans]
MDIFSYNRIMIVGNNGSGKSFLSKELSDITGLPLIHLDVEYWRPNWENPAREEWIKQVIELTSKERWIIDGNHTSTMELRFKAADLVIFLDINRFVCLARVLLRNGKKRSDTPEYLEEKFDKAFLRFCKGLWSFSKTRRHVITDLHKKYPDKPFFVIHTRREKKRLLNQWRDEKAKYTNQPL